MPNLTEILGEINSAGSGHDVVRRKYLAKLSLLTGRDTIIYYSGWLQKNIPGLVPHLIVNDNDKNGFMAAIHQLGRKSGLDLVLHTPGGDIAATESLVHYLRQMFGTDIRAIIPQIAMSAGTMVALASKEILMGKHSNLGPIDPQIGGVFPAHGVIEEFTRAGAEISEAETSKEQQAKIALWQPIIAKYSPTLIGQCLKAIKMSTDITTEWLESGMFVGESDAKTKAQRITAALGSHDDNKTHARHIHRERLVELGLKIIEIEQDQDIQDTILSLHHACIHTLTHTPAIKLIENQMGVGLILSAQFQFQSSPASGSPIPIGGETMAL